MPALGRLVHFDERSRGYPVRGLVEAKKPRTISWRCTTYLDQGNEGACVGFACAHELAAKPIEVSVDFNMARGLYHDAQRVDQWEGGAYPGAKPFYEGTSVLAGLKVIQQRGYVPEYRWAFGLDDLILSVSNLGPAIIGVNWYTGMFDTDQRHFINISGRVEGGHAIMVRGVSIRKEAFVLHNSWGTKWGRYGQAYISFDDMARLLREDGEAAIPLRREFVR